MFRKIAKIALSFLLIVIFFLPIKAFAESNYTQNEELFQSVCENYEMLGLSTKCESNLYKVEKPLIYKHQLTAPIHALYVHLNSKDANIDLKSCSFELNEEIIFERFCNPKVTIIEKDIMLIGSGMYFVYARRTNDTLAKFDTNDVWDVYWNEEAFADHAHAPLGKARLVSEACLQGDNFKACIE